MPATGVLLADLSRIAVRERSARVTLAHARRDRDELIEAAHRAGATDREIAVAAGLDASRVTRILRARVGWRGQGRRKRP